VRVAAHEAGPGDGVRLFQLEPVTFWVIHVHSVNSLCMGDRVRPWLARGYRPVTSVSSRPVSAPYPSGLLRVDVTEPQQEALMVTGDVPTLAHQGAVVARFELVPPDASGHVGLELSFGAGLPAMRRFSSNSTTVLAVA